ncbi:hypothetical protein [uncultured Bilophila sp.]|nr:hypothetical protein [uncultured Bilophila sp.]
MPKPIACMIAVSMAWCPYHLHGTVRKNWERRTSVTTGIFFSK